MKKFIYSLMTDKSEGPVATVLKPILYAISLIYAVAISVRGLLYKAGLFASSRVPIKIISVGNLTLGGTGKTPFVITLARILKDQLHKEMAILIRGYGWDEQALLKKKLLDIPILVGKDRAKSAHRAIRLYGVDTALLDDGFQHWELSRDLDIVLVDSSSPFGNGCLFPRGILREPKEAMKRADVAVLTKADRGRGDIETLKRNLLGINAKLIFAEAEHKPKHFYDTRTKKIFDISFVKGKKVVCLSSIGDPEYFQEIIKKLGAEVATHIVYMDHHNYSQKDRDNILNICNEKSFEFIITTEKDVVKLSRMSLSFERYAVMALAIEMEIISGMEALVDRLHRLYTR